MNVSENFKKIRTNITLACEKVGRDPSEVTVIAVTKYVSVERAFAAVESGVKHLGENRPEGLLAKQKSKLSSQDICWHFIGTLQSRKVKDVVNHIDMLHSLDRLSVAKEIEKRSESVINCFVQVNVSGEESKHGITEADLDSFIEQLSQYKKIRVIGLMTMAPHTENKTLIRTVFKRLKNCQLRIQEKAYPHAPCNELSMGMSNDYEIAIEEGATFVRIGTALVGHEE
ncbi:pyridoxal phosphate enzyme (YggS family) [Pullulanibacillus pueri]|uniref:Pyridoxal phosphate homeostasis protein n=1 Tax=Pullulanibacillus pueri TaxID=1437324 RepID=A0A8J2ZT25_9BACL|nr:YggS family pyridoxal phosphate-dependent enzyme [Pullulanibacillus pueri]MBM7680148.1 pyridoxal phosphate enzyme (YggS family) [Pullulanibacillus pueri]GGH74583.1 UPF0001 protein YlmE [Pullulanibacillus pueri]